MNLKYHGIQIDQDDQSGIFQYGILRLLHELVLYNQRPEYLLLNERQLTWAKQWKKPKFLHITKAFQSNFWKFDRAACYLNRCIKVLKEYRNPFDMSDILLKSNAWQDIPLYLDLMLMYIRIQADTLACAVPYFYNNPPLMVTKSFRGQMNWFIKARSNFDPEYTTLLKENTDWFDVLSGKETPGSSKGLRDILVHHQGRYELLLDKQSGTEDFQPHVLLMSESFGVHDNLLPTLQSITASYFLFLDKAFVLFAGRLRELFGPEFISEGEDAAKYYTFKNDVPDSAWIYPTLR